MTKRPTTPREASAISKKQLAIRDLHWPKAEPYLWNRKAHKGFTTIPKTMPMILKIMDEMTKGAPVSFTYLNLWCNTWDNSFVTLNRNGEMANASGFGGQRGEHTWLTRVKKLQELCFIDVKPGKSGPIGNAIIWNPHLVIRWHKDQGTPGLTSSSFNALLEQALEIGAQDMIGEDLPDLASLSQEVSRTEGVYEMKGLVYTTKFKKDLKRERKIDPGVEKLLRDVIAALCAWQELPLKMKDHPLYGDWKDHRDCHLKPDLVLIYKSDEADITLARLGSHSELF